jgi:hypothetical protein
MKVSVQDVPVITSMSPINFAVDGLSDGNRDGEVHLACGVPNKQIPPR